tara:strand:- start:431 stop:2296 length:1866 start_codon:yes stop_codon:yes gene_type:complete
MFKTKLKIFIKNIPPKSRVLILISIDSLLILLSIFITLRFKIASDLDQDSIPYIYPIILISSILIYSLTGLYNGLTRYIDSFSLYKLAFRNFLILTIIKFAYRFINFYFLNFTDLVILFCVLTSFTGLGRFVLRDLLLYIINPKFKKRKSVIIYGAGPTGVELANSFKRSGKYKIKIFLDDSKKLWDRNIYGIPILKPNKENILSASPELIVLAISNLDSDNKRKILNFLQQFNIKVLQIPNLIESDKNRQNIDALKPILIKDILGRNKVSPKGNFLAKSVLNKNICVTGGGGSIGSELSKQIIKFQPKKLFLIENNEPSLYKIKQELQQINLSSIKVESILADVNESCFFENFLRENQIDIIFHAAAYKHVPIVEENPIAGIKNNVFSTLNICRASIKYKVKKVILISTDKAVRPTNIMGASKRLAEISLLYYSLKNSNTIFSIVRFGNVLNSSGSVVPLFEKQIKSGGPVTVTHKDVIRYFMMIPEAAELVMQASYLTKGGEIFLLDMGEPIKVYDLAKKMINLSGLSIKDENNLEGAIEILTTGLRPGEKLFEELLVDGESTKTKHPLIFTSKEKIDINSETWELINKLKTYLNENDKINTLKTLKKLVPEWTSSYQI